MKKNWTLTIVLVILLVLVLMQTLSLTKLKKTVGTSTVAIDENKVSGNAALDTADTGLDLEKSILVDESENNAGDGTALDSAGVEA